MYRISRGIYIAADGRLDHNRLGIVVVQIERDFDRRRIGGELRVNPRTNGQVGRVGTGILCDHLQLLLAELVHGCRHIVGDGLLVHYTAFVSASLQVTVTCAGVALEGERVAFDNPVGLVHRGHGLLPCIVRACVDLRERDGGVNRVMIRGCGRFLGVVFLYGQPLACSVFYRAFPARRLFDPRMVVPADVLAGEAAGLLARTLLPMPGDARTRPSYGRRTPRPRRCRGCTPSRPWTGPGRAGPSGPAIPATGSGIRGRRETAGRSSACSVAAARTRHRVAPVPRSATSRPCAPLPCRRGSRSSGKGRPCRHGP